MNTVTTQSQSKDVKAYCAKPSLLEDKFVDMEFMTGYTGLTDKWFYKLIQDGKFPRPVKFGRSSRWLKSDIEAWVIARVEASR